MCPVTARPPARPHAVCCSRGGSGGRQRSGGLATARRLSSEGKLYRPCSDCLDSFPLFTNKLPVIPLYELSCYLSFYPSTPCICSVLTANSIIWILSMGDFSLGSFLCLFQAELQIRVNIQDPHSPCKGCSCSSRENTVKPARIMSCLVSGRGLQITFTDIVLFELVHNEVFKPSFKHHI